MPDQTEIDALKAILTEDYSALGGVGEECDGFETVAEETIESKRWHDVIQVVTRGPSGQHYAWTWWCGLTEEQESEGPADHGMVLTPVHPVEETITVTKWVRDA